MATKNNNPGRILKGTKTQPSLKGASGVWTIDEALQYHRANQWPVPNLYQPIPGSLRIKSGQSTTPAYLTRSVNKDGNRKTWTFSTWIKLGNYTTPSGGIRTIIEGFTGATNAYAALWITSGNALGFGSDDNNGSDGSVSTAGVFRDPTAWYHVMLVMDTTQATNTNRVKIYVNGIQQSLSGTWPVQNYSYFMNTSGTTTSNNSIINNYGSGVRIGTRWNTTYSQDFDGFMSETIFVDGYALQPSLFGQLDSTGTWVPIPYTGTYGTNGFYLPFTNSQTSQTVGYDASLTGTTTYNADQDPYRGSVSLHLDGNGSPGGQNKSFIDSSSNNLLITLNGTVTQGSYSPFPMPTTTPYNPAIHGASGWFDGSTGSLVTAASSANALGGGAYTIEAWVNLTSSSGATFGQQIAGTYSGSGSTGWTFQINRTSATVSAVAFSNANGPSNVFYYGTTSSFLQANQWYHLAVVRTSTSAGGVTLYINGVAVTTGTDSYNDTTSLPLYVGAQTVAAAALFPGYISNLRITKAAVYTSAFTPTNKPFSTATNNLFPWSEDFTQNNSLYQGAITPGSAVAPDGTPSATYLTTTTSGSSQYGFINFQNQPQASTSTFSVYAKAGSVYTRIGISNRSANTFGVVFDLTSGTLVNTYNGTGTVSNTTITSAGNGWYRISVTTSVSNQYNIHPLPSTETSGNDIFTNGATLIAGQGIYVWGLQLEATGTLGNYTPTPANFSTAPAVLLNFANASVIDSTGSNNLVTVSNAQASGVGKFGSGGVSFNNASNDYLLLPYNGNMYFGTSNFTIECWWKSTNTEANYATIIGQGFTGSPVAGTWAFKVSSSSSVVEFTYGSGLTNIDGTSSVNDGAWHHIAAVRNNSTITIFVDGNLQTVASIAASQVIGISTVNVYIGYESRDASYLNGTVDDLRVTNGVARYTTNFTPSNRPVPEIGGKSFVTNNVNTGIVKQFTNIGSTTWTAPVDVTTIEVLVVGGGGSGGSSQNGLGGGGGGGAGGLIYYPNYPVVPGQTYYVLVGSGAPSAASSTNVQGTNGGSSIFNNLVAYGGGGGGSGSNAGLGSGLAGASGGGGGYAGYTTVANGAASNVPGQGFAGSGVSSVSAAGGGGGGAGGPGGTNTGSGGGIPGPGGVGLTFGISGAPVTYATGGTGGSNSASGAANTGNGGGGCYANSGPSGAGGSGVVIIRYMSNATLNFSDYTTDTLTESPTLYGHDLANGGEVVGNYATWNPLDNYFSGSSQSASGYNFINGNLTIVNSSASWVGQRATLAYPNYGQWYYEVHIDSASGSAFTSGIEVGITQSSSYPAAPASYPDTTLTSYIYRLTGNRYGGGTNFGTSFPSFTVGDTIGVAFDAGAGTLNFYKNGVNVGSPFTSLSGSFMPVIGTYTACQVSTNFGQRPWAYSPPFGYQALNTKNFQRPTLQPNQYFDAVTYTGTGASQNIVLPGGFQPDLVWVKSRSGAGSNYLRDSARGSTLLSSDVTTVEFSADAINPLNTNGFTVSASTGTNAVGVTYVAWCWKKGAAQGFDIQTYTSNGATDTVTHALGAVPSMIIVKSRTTTANWWVYHIGTGTGKSTSLNQTIAQVNDTWVVNSSNFQYTYGVPNGTPVVAYLWTSVPGFSQFGSYTGNGSVDGTFVYCGFKPRWIMTKRADSTGDWLILDTARNPTNPLGEYLAADSSGAGVSTYTICDIVSNGFKLRITTDPNIVSSTIIYAAFADKPFGNTNGTAR